MQIYLSAILTFMSCLALTTGVSFAVRETNSGKVRWYLLAMAVSVALWTGGHGMMVISYNYDLAYIFRVISLAGIIGYLAILELFMTFLTDMQRCFKCGLNTVTIVLAFMDCIIFSDRKCIEFVTVGGRVTFYGVESLGRSFHNLFLVLIASLLILTALLWNKNIESLRIKRFIKLLFVSNIAIIVGTLPDTILPLFGMPAFPSSDFGGFFAYMLVWFYAVKNNIFNLAVLNVSNYIFESGNSAILIFDEKTNLSLSNEYAKQLLGIRADEEYHGLSGIFRLDREQENEIIEQTFSADRYTANLRSLNGDVPCSFNSSIVKDRFGEPYCMIIFVYDMTNEEKMKNDVIAANQAKSNFLANMSHEIRTPINSVLGFDELIIRETKEEETLEYAKNIQSAGKALLSIINDILDFSKIESGKMDIIPVKYQLSSLLNDSYNMIFMRAREKNLELITEFDEKLPAVLFGDEIRMRQICINLLTNAVKYTKHGSVTLRAYEKGVEEDIVKLVIEVEDTGVGISEEGKSLLFTSFKRIDEKYNRNIEGTGLGLTITKQLVDLMGGQIEVESVYGKGSTFRIIVPQKIVSATPIGKFDIGTSEKQEEDKGRLYAPEAKVLVVDDVKMNLKVFTGLLKKTGIQVDTAASGEECLHKIAQQEYHMIFLDHMMPVMDGIETMHAMKKLNTDQNLNQNTPVIMLTANALEGAKETYLAEGFSDYLTKPIRSQLLEEMILQYLPEELTQG